jgi:hypothetical protein
MMIFNYLEEDDYFYGFDNMEYDENELDDDHPIDLVHPDEFRVRL